MKQFPEFELIGPDMDEVLDAINFINKEYKLVKLNPIDWSLLNTYNHSIFIKIEPGGNENIHVRFINDMLFENNFNCKLYKIK